MKQLKVPVVLLGLIFMVPYGCGEGGTGGSVGEPRDEGSQPPISRFNATFIGDMTTQGERDSVDTVHMSLTAGSPLEGTFFRINDGATGTIAGNVEGESATYTGTSEGDCPSSFEGSMNLNGDDTLKVSMEGSDCRGSFLASGVLTKVASLDMAGRFRVSERATATCTFEGESETETVTGTVDTFLEQTGQKVRYSPPEVDLPREGEIAGNNISFSGQFALPFVGDVQFDQNRVSLQGKIRNENFFTLTGTGFAAGSVGGRGFLCRGESSAVFQRRFDVLLAVLRGGPITLRGSENDEHNVALTDMANRHRSNRVAAKVFDAFPGIFGASQITHVQNWFRDQNTDEPGNPVPAILVGHSLGGDGALRVGYGNICSRILLDHWDPAAINPFTGRGFLNQRTESPRLAPEDGQIVHFLAESPAKGLLGRRLRGSNVTEIGPLEGTDHETITMHKDVLPTLDREITRCARL